MGHPMRLEPVLAGLLVKLANHYITRDALEHTYTHIEFKLASQVHLIVMKMQNKRIDQLLTLIQQSW